MSPTQPTPQKIPFTQAAYHQMELDFERLTQERKDVLVRLQAAREMGDLSENGAYTYAKLELGTVTRQLRQLKYLLEYGQVTTAATTEQVGFGKTVTLKNDTGKEVTYTLVSIHESDLSAFKLSTESPLGAALIGKKVGETAKVIAPARTTVYTIVSIS